MFSEVDTSLGAGHEGEKIGAKLEGMVLHEQKSVRKIQKWVIAGLVGAAMVIGMPIQGGFADVGGGGCWGEKGR